MSEFGFQWHITDRCNMACAHCYQSDFSAKSERSVQDLCRLADQIFKGVGGRSVSINLTGGEPLLYADFPALLRYLGGIDNLEEVNLITNGTVVAEDSLVALRELGRDGCLKVSLESADREINDRIRGRGNLDGVVGNLPFLMERTGRDAVLMMTLGGHNYRGLAGMVDLAMDCGASGVIFERFVPLGVGAEIADQVLTPQDWLEIAGQIGAICDLGVSADDLARYAAFWISIDGEGELSLKGAHCNLGGDSMALMPGGDVYPCRRLPVKVGNVLETPFDEILERLKDHRPIGEWQDDCLGCRALKRVAQNQLLG